MDGWAFLVARGRQHGYRCVLAPDFLVDSNEYGLLTSSVRGDASSASLTAPVAGPLALAYRTHRLAAADGVGAPVTDMHGRPLDLSYGFVSRAGGLGSVSDADMRAALGLALAAYRRFLADESGFRVSASQAFTLRGALPASSLAGSGRGPAGSGGSGGSPGSGPVGGSGGLGPRRWADGPAVGRTGRRPGGSRRWRLAVGLVAVAGLVAAAGAGASRLWPGIDVPARAGCDLAASTRRCAIQVPVRATGFGGLSYAGASIEPGTGAATWRLDDSACRAAAGSACVVTVTVTVPRGATGREFTTTLTVRLGGPSRTGTVALAARG
jgi:hypothetical protein